MSEALLLCYNKGCGKEYKESENNEKSCRHHPGEPIFHDAMKGWSCCKKKSPDFTEFLNIPGCTTSAHSNVKPKPPASAKKTDSSVDGKKEEASIVKPPVPMERPSSSEKLLQLPMTVSDSLKQALSKQLADSNKEADQSVSTGDSSSSQPGVITKGTICKNNACTTVYEDESTDNQACIYHPGVHVFHEGMKYWSCCEQKTTDFNSFLSQAGCVTGKHTWIKKEEKSEDKRSSCRFDWHQTASFVTISIFSKNPSPHLTSVEANKVVCKVNITFEKDSKLFKQDFNLKGIVDPSRSDVKLMASKVEVSLRKMEPGSWPALHLNQ